METWARHQRRRAHQPAALLRGRVLGLLEAAREEQLARRLEERGERGAARSRGAAKGVGRRRRGWPARARARPRLREEVVAVEALGARGERRADLLLLAGRAACAAGAGGAAGRAASAVGLPAGWIGV
jgi:hypothetical protein